MTGLSTNTTYFIRAYATNSIGTAYGNQVSFTNKTITDIDGNVYHTVTIGTQTWMVENLKTTQYNDGTEIPLVTDNIVWYNLSTPAYCWYNNDAADYKNKYGALYNWYAVNTAKLAPTGWHVPTDAEWTTLENYVSANLGVSLSVGKALAATTDWTTGGNAGTIGYNLTLNNSTGFSALPGGRLISISNSAFNSVGTGGYWWSSTAGSTSNAWLMNLDNSSVGMGIFFRASGSSVRCIKD